MLGRLGFIGRVVLILLALLMAFVVLGLALSVVGRERRETGAERFPVPAQAAAIVELIDGTGRELVPRVLAAVSSEMFVVRVVERLPAQTAAVTRMPGVEWLVAQYLEAIPDRSIVAYRRHDEEHGALLRAFERLTADARAPVSISVALRNGGYVTFELRSDGTRRVFGIPVGFWIGTLGFLFAALALWAIAREARPLRDLVASVERFAGHGEPQTVMPRGAAEIRRLIAATNDMQARIAALLRGRTILLGAISHDLKTYMTRLRLRAEAIDDDDQRHKTIRDLDDMTAMIDDALAVARGTTALQRTETIDLATLLADEVARREDAAIGLALPRAPAPIDADPVGLRRVAANLIDNARRHGTACRVVVAADDRQVTFTVEDNGVGIPVAEQDAVFEPFYRLEPSRSRATGGAGLGLTIARQIVEAHGGTIAVARSGLGGACLRVILPRSRESLRQPEVVSPSAGG